MEQYIDTAFSKDFSHNSSLLLEIETKQVSYLIYDSSNGRIQVLKQMTISGQFNGVSFHEELKNLINKEDLLHLRFASVKINLAMSAFTLVPKLLFEETLMEKYLSFSAQVDTKHAVSVNAVKPFLLKNVFACDAQLKTYLQKTFPDAKIFHLTTALLQFAAQHTDDLASSQLILDVRQDILHILYLQKNELIYLNQFQYKSKEDFLYYVLLVCDQLDINRNECNLQMSGYITTESTIYAELYKFFRNISFAQSREYFILPKELTEVPLHFYNTLMSLHLCE